MDAEFLAGIERRLCKAAGKEGLDDRQKNTVKRRLDDLAASYEAAIEGYADYPPLDDQIAQVKALGAALDTAAKAVAGLYQDLWEVLALETSFPAETTRDLFKAAHGEKAPMTLVFTHGSGVDGLRDAAERLVERLETRHTAKDRDYPVPVELVVDRFGHLFSIIVGSYPPISATGLFVQCVNDLLEWLDPGAGENVTSESVKRATRYCVENVWNRHP